jgi:prevent-host-death family protein
MKQIWQLQEAKNKFSEVVEEALSKGPQIVTKRGVEAVVVLSCKDYRKLLSSPKPISEFFRQSPLAGVDLDLNRNKDDLRSDITL